MLCAVDCTRGVVQAMVEPHAGCAIETSMAGGTHVAFLASDGSLAAFQPAGLPGVQTAGPDALCDALLLMFAALVDGHGVAFDR